MMVKLREKNMNDKTYEEILDLYNYSYAQEKYLYRDLKKLTENELIIKEKKGRSNIYKIGKNIYIN